MSVKQKLFDLVHSTGKLLEGPVHIFDITNKNSEIEEIVYRVYDNDGHCFDICREKAETEFIYSYYGIADCSWSTISVQGALHILQIKLKKMNHEKDI